MIISVKRKTDNTAIEKIKNRILTFGSGESDHWKKSVIADKQLFDLLFKFVFSDDKRLAWRACWIIDTASEDFPELLADKLPFLIEGLLSTANSSLKRHFTRILCRYSIPEKYLGRLIDRSFELLSPTEPVAVRAFAMQLLFNMTRQIPDLKGELISVLEYLAEEGGSAGFMNRSTKLLRQLKS